MRISAKPTRRRDGRSPDDHTGRRSALRYYNEREPIPSHRTSGNRRRYEQATLLRVAFIWAAQNVGLSLDEIGAALASPPEGRTPTERDWHHLSRE